MPLLLPLVLALPLQAAPVVDAPEAHQFDFWLGEWSVQNRHLQPGAQWVDGAVARARIVPVLDGLAVLEEWSGELRPGSRMSGFSLRAYDRRAKEWVILLDWSPNGGSQFGLKRGTFRHGRGEFTSRWTDAEGKSLAERYTFSDGLENTCRWDQARSSDGGETWRTDWIMEFTRTAPAGSLEHVLDTEWVESNASPHAEARWLDFAAGVRTSEDGKRRVRGGLVGERRLVILQMERRVEDGWRAEEFWTFSYLPREKQWVAYSLHRDSPVLQKWTATHAADGRARFAPGAGDDSRPGRRVGLRVDGGALVWTVEQDSGNGLGVGEAVRFE